MSLFMLETETATAGADQINSLASQVSNLSSTVSSYDTSNEDGFNFDSAKTVLANNLEACSTKMKNTSTIIESVVSNHTDLQNSLKFDVPTDSDDSNKKDTDDDGDNPNDPNDYGYTPTGGGYTPSGGAPAAATVPAVIPSVTDEEDDEEMHEVEPEFEEELDEEATESYENTIVTTPITSSGYAYLENDLINEDTKKFISNSKFIYDNDGYARYGDYYVISCDTSVGKVGDIIQFTQKDGSVVDCIVGVNTTSQQFKNAVNFIVKKDATQFKALDFTKTLISNNDVITNLGDINSLNSDGSTELPTITSTITTDNDIDSSLTIPLDTNVEQDETVSV